MDDNKDLKQNIPDNMPSDNENSDENANENQSTELASPDFKYLGDPNVHSDEKQHKNSAFKRLRPIIALCVVAVLLVSSAFILKEVLPAPEEPSIDDNDNKGIEIFDLSGSTADKMEIQNTNDSFTFVKKVEKTYVIEGKEDLPVNNATILSALSNFGSLTADSVVAEDVTSFKQYGLDEPLSKVTWTKGEETHYIELGTLASSGGYYMRVDGGNTVYTYNSTNAKYYMSPRMDFYDTKLFDFDEESDASYINHFVIGKKGGDTVDVILQDITDETVDSAYLIVEPIEHNFSIEKSSAITELMKTLTSCTVYDDDLSPKNLEKYGLDDPEYTFSFTNVQQVNTAYFGNLSDEGYRYMYADGHDFIYIVDEDDINILQHDIAYYCENMSYVRSYDTIDSITISGGGKRYEIDITGTAEDDNMKAYINNKYVEYENFANLYAHILSIEIKEVGEKQPDDELLVTVTIDCNDGTQDVLKYYKQSDVNSFYELNGKGRLIVSTAKVEQILKFAQQLYDGEEIVLDW